ncbi:hypothetical protein HOLleu_23996 [Holothuria leucospilota]|uniref:Uncharacterized protein n=1 Tax=Holothuria leucospilota TaxID=206669 RepID=A0A9Q1H389_HOLLE|nr:hypothetical protein HOLleu_23996 [Holothuria leucospilota]
MKTFVFFVVLACLFTIALALKITELTNVVAQDTRHQVARQRQFVISTVKARAALIMDGAAGKMCTAPVMIAQITEVCIA